MNNGKSKIHNSLFMKNMESLIETFHIDWKLLLAQIINFSVVFAVLYWFAFKPLAKVMADRADKIAKGLADAKAAEEKLVETQAEFNKTVAEAKKQASVILEKAARDAEEKKQQTITKAKEEIGAIISQEKQKIQAEKNQTLKELKKEVADLVVESVAKILEEKVDSKKDKELIKKIIKN